MKVEGLTEQELEYISEFLRRRDKEIDKLAKTQMCGPYTKAKCIEYAKKAYLIGFLEASNKSFFFLKFKRMKVNLPKETENSIDLYAINLSEGLLITHNPEGVILKNEDEEFFLHTSSDTESCALRAFSMQNLWRDISGEFPNIAMEYFSET